MIPTNACAPFSSTCGKCERHAVSKVRSIVPFDVAECTSTLVEWIRALRFENVRQAGDAEAFRVQALEFMNNAIFGDGADEQAEKIRFFLAMSEDEQAELLGEV